LAHPKRSNTKGPPVLVVNEGRRATKQQQRAGSRITEALAEEDRGAVEFLVVAARDEETREVAGTAPPRWTWRGRGRGLEAASCRMPGTVDLARRGAAARSWGCGTWTRDTGDARKAREAGACQIRQRGDERATTQMVPCEREMSEMERNGEALERGRRRGQRRSSRMNLAGGSPDRRGRRGSALVSETSGTRASARRQADARDAGEQGRWSPTAGGSRRPWT